MKTILEKLFTGKLLTKEDAGDAMKKIALGESNRSHTAAFITVYKMRTVTLEELEGFRETLFSLCIKPDLNEFDAMDVCGTGGDGKNTFNISTLAAFVLAGAGIKIAKHGNYGVSGPCGSSTVLEYAGVKFTNDESKLKTQLEQSGICFMHAPLFHPALRNVADIRKELGVKTFFNMLGPMINPAQPGKQLVGVYDLELARIYNYLFQADGKKYVIVHSLDGYDELSLTTDAKILSQQGERMINAGNFDLKRISAADISGGSTIEKSLEIFINVLKNEATVPQKNVVCANAAIAVHCIYPELQLTDAFAIAVESIESGRAFNSFKKYVQLTQ